MKYQILLLGAAAALVAGCDYQTKPIGAADHFPPEEKMVLVDAAMNQQIRAGSRYDATLYSSHFDGRRLNSLGEEKLAQIIHSHVLDGHNEPITVYVATSSDKDGFAERREAIQRFVSHYKNEKLRVEVRNGWNPDLTYPSEAALASLEKLERTPNIPPADQSRQGTNMNAGPAPLPAQGGGAAYP